MTVTMSIRDCVDQIWDMRAELWAGEGYDRLDTIVTDAFSAGLARGADTERERIRRDLIEGDPGRLETALRRELDDEEAADACLIVDELLGGTS